MTGHAPVAPSGAGIWVPCNGALRLQEKHPDPGDDADAKDGDTCHEISKRALLSGAAAGDSIGGIEGVTEEIIDAAQFYIDAVRQIHGGRQSKLYVEETIPIPMVHAECWGTPDVWFSDTDDVHIPDLKYGWGLVSVIRNWQLLIYGMGCRIRCGYPAGVKRFHFHIIQPRPWHPDGKIRTWTIDSADLTAYELQARTAAEKAYSGKGTCNTGRHCRYCSALLHCTTAQMVWTSILELVGSMGSINVEPVQLGMELHILRRGLDMIKHRLSAVEEAALRLDQAGTTIPGWQRGSTAGTYGWAVTPEQVRAVAALFGAKVDKPADLITPTQAEKAGLPKEIIASMAKRTPGKSKMEPVDLEKFSIIFGAKG